MAENIIQLRIGDVEVRCQGEDDWPRHQLEEVLKTLKEHLPERMQGEPDETPPPSAAELLEASAARTFGDKAGVAAWWLQTFGGRARWRSGEIVDVLKEAGEAVPTNITDTLNQKRQKGLFESKDRMWALTGEGLGWVKYSLLRGEA